VVLARLLPDGSPDPTFGTAGEVVVYVGTDAALGAMLLGSNGKLILAGSSTGGPPGATFIARVWN
jgi:hypothetical protein